MRETCRYPFARWLDSQAGQSWLQAERLMIALLAHSLVGGHAVQVSLTGQTLLDQVPAVSRHTFSLSSNGQFAGGVVGHSDEWPMQDDSVKLVVIHHAHEAVAHPQRLMQETSRVLSTGGLAVYCALGRGPAGARPDHLEGLTVMSPGALRRGITESGMRPGACRMICADQSRLNGVLGWLENWLPENDYLAAWGGGFVMSARKPDRGSPIVNLRSVKSHALDGAVSSSPARGV